MSAKTQPSLCGWCIAEMDDLVLSHPDTGEMVGSQCPLCDRIYLTELDEYNSTLRIDKDTTN